MRYSFFLLLLFTGTVSFAQFGEPEWSELSNRKGQLLRFLPTSDSSSFYALRWSGNRMFGNYLITLHDDLKVVADRRLKIHIDKSICSYVSVDMIDDQCALFLSDIRENKNHLFVRLYSRDLQTVVKEEELAVYEFEKGHQKGVYGVRFSEDRRFMAVVWEKLGKKNTEHVYGYRVFNTNLELKHEGEYSLPFRSDLSEIQGHYLSNKGGYFMAVTEYDLDSTKMLYRNQKYFKSLHIYHIDETGLIDYPVDLENKKIYTMIMSSEDSSMVSVSGLYGLQDEVGIRGVFYQKLDMLREREIDKGFCELKTDIITEGWTDRAKKKLKKKEERGKEDAIFFNYEMRATIPFEDSSLVGTMEQHFIQERMTDMQQGGLSSNTFYYYYNDIIVYKINSKGSFDWTKKIRKYQVSTNDGGPFSGYIGYNNDTTMYFLFNDHLDNYDTLGQFIDTDEVYITNYGRHKNVVARTQLDMRTGKLKRSILYKRTDNNLLFVPKLSMDDKLHHRVLLYGIKGRKEKIGVIYY